jgi:tagatose-6-phosphate ketose/aldose isomerase
MNSYLSISSEELKQKNAYWTAREISQQPACWRKVLQNIEKHPEEISNWLAPILETSGLRIVLTGAGTSAYIGESVAPYLSKQTGRLFEAISTTDLVSNPLEYLVPSIPTLLISYGRSGDSPESVAAINVTEQVIENCFHLIISCNKDGGLARFGANSSNAFNLLMPEETLDQSFAMTSSFTSMYVATLSLFSPNTAQLALAIESASAIIDNSEQLIERSSRRESSKLVFLGSGCLSGIAKEASLKLLELTAGKIECYNETPLGFRHGPKSLVNTDTEVVVLNSNDAYAGQYDMDLIKELKTDKVAKTIICLSEELNGAVTGLEGAWLGLPYVVYCQIYALSKSLSYGITPDNPCPSGEVNRVVQGVEIYPLLHTKNIS